MISNKEVFAELIPFLHDHEVPGVTPQEFKGLLRELGFDRPTSRRKMKIFTWAEIEDGAYERFEKGEEQKPVRLALVFTSKAQRMLGVRVEMPESIKQKLSGTNWLVKVKDWLIASRDEKGQVSLSALAEFIKKELGLDTQKALAKLFEEGLIAESPELGKAVVV